MKGMIFFISSVFFSLTSCASLTPPSMPQLKQLSPCNAALAASLQKRSHELKTLKGTALVRINFKDGKEIAGRGMIVVKRPDKLRLEVVGPFNQITAVIIYDSRSLSFLSLRENRLYGDYPFPMEASRFPNYLAGLPAGEVKSHDANHETGFLPSGPCSVNSEDEQIMINRTGNMKEIYISETRDEIHPINVSMDSYKEVDGFMFPFEISISNKEAHIFIRYTDVELNQQISDGLFSLPQ